MLEIAPCSLLMVENSKLKCIPPAILHPLVFAQVPFEAHTDFFQHMCRGSILKNAVCPDAMKMEVVKAECQQHRSGLCRVPVAPVATIQLVAKIGFPCVGELHADATIADKLTILS